MVRDPVNEGGCGGGRGSCAGALVGWRVYEHGYALPQATCGSAVTHGLGAQTQLLSADPGTLPCFRAAAMSCRSASMKVIEMGVDAATDCVFVIKPGPRVTIWLIQLVEVGATVSRVIVVLVGLLLGFVLILLLGLVAAWMATWA